MLVFQVQCAVCVRLVTTSTQFVQAKERNAASINHPFHSQPRKQAAIYHGTQVQLLLLSLVGSGGYPSHLSGAFVCVDCRKCAGGPVHRSGTS